jgi:hypothetical protein
MMASRMVQRGAWRGRRWPSVGPNLARERSIAVGEQPGDAAKLPHGAAVAVERPEARSAQAGRSKPWPFDGNAVWGSSQMGSAREGT